MSATLRETYPTLTRSTWFLAQLWTEIRGARAALQIAEGPDEIYEASQNLYQVQTIANILGLQSRIRQWDQACDPPKRGSRGAPIPPAAGPSSPTPQDGPR